jgi:hypothetical protein
VNRRFAEGEHEPSQYRRAKLFISEPTLPVIGHRRGAEFIARMIRGSGLGA